MFAFGDASKKNRVRGVARRYELPRYRYAAPSSMDSLRIPGYSSNSGYLNDARNPLRVNVIPAPGMPGNELEGIPELDWGRQDPNNPVTSPAPVIQEPPFYVTVPGFTGKSKGGVKAY